MAVNGNGNNSKTGMDWKSNTRWAGITRPYTAQDVDRLRGSLHIEHTLARQGAERLWELLQSESSNALMRALTAGWLIRRASAAR